MPAIAFASLFLGLVAGLQQVELLVNDNVAAVQILLDGEHVGSVTEAPWRLACDLGPALRPHELVAVAYDAGRRELGRARQWINLPRDTAEAEVVISRSDGGRQVATIAWDALPGEEPRAISFSFDGRPLAADSSGSSVVLPVHDPSVPHFLRLELVFRDQVRKHLEILQGGPASGQTATELTAVPLLASTLRRLPSQGDLIGCLAVKERPLRVAAVESEHAELLVVIDRDAVSSLGVASARGRLPARTTRLRTASNIQDQLHLLALPREDQRVRLVLPFAKTETATSGLYQLFSITAPHGREHGGLVRVARSIWTTWEASRQVQGPQRLADAVAVAGVEATRDGRRRAVLLVISPEPEDESSFSAEDVRAYLRSLRVPLVVWCPDTHRVKNSPWGKVKEVSTYRTIAAAFNEVARLLDRQQIVWVDGAYLPSQITLTGQAKGVTLAK